MPQHKIVSQSEWTAQRKAFLAREKEFTRARDRLSAERRALPWVKVEKPYVFETPAGKKTLAELFDGKSQLIVYHFMLGPGWVEGCPSCSYLADHFDGSIIHLSQRDAAFVVVSRAPLAEIEAYKKRMGWQFRWVSSFGSDFNFDYQVSLRDDEIGAEATYNYERQEIDSGEMPGASVFYKDESGSVFHTYSAYARGLDILVGAYNWLDLTPKGRDEEKLPWSMAWVRRHDEYDEAPESESCCAASRHDSAA
jgi:predicted dithiol-disulfide oxidoreductase (DUF899 family)